MNKAARIIRIGTPALGFGAFCLWLLTQAQPLSFGTVFACISAALFFLTLSWALIRLVKGPEEESLSQSEPADTKWDRLAAWGSLLLFGIAVTLLEYIAVYLLSDAGTKFVDSFQRLYYRSDVAHYMGIARDWYVPEGDERLRLVFLPLYPLISRAFAWSGDYFLGALLAAQLFSLLCLPAAYELFRLDLCRASAMACARILFLLPGAAFLRVPMSEGLFLFLTLTAVCFARKKRFLLSGLFTALSAFTRSLGILLLGLLAIEMLFGFLDARRRDKAAAVRLIPPCLGGLLLGCCGTLLYLAINHQITGSPFTFLTYQRENWNQRLGLFFNTAAYQAEYARMYWESGDLDSLLSLSIPNLVCCFGTLGLLFADRKRMRLSYLLWSLTYFAVSVGATWLLSGPRYLAMLFPLALTLRRLCDRPLEELALEGTLLVTQTGYLLMLALDMSVY